jgi:hypothetical protein
MSVYYVEKNQDKLNSATYKRKPGPPVRKFLLGEVALPLTLAIDSGRMTLVLNRTRFTTATTFTDLDLGFGSMCGLRRTNPAGKAR